MSLIALVALSFVTSAFAQDESPSPTPEESPSATPEEKASATVESAPAATASPTETKAAKKEETTTEKKDAAAGEKKEATAASTTSKPAAPAAAAASGRKLTGTAALGDLENRFAVALGKHDAASIEPMVADDYVGVTSKGKVENRRAMLSSIKSDKDTYTLTKNEKLDVRMYGKDVAVAVGTYREKGTTRDGQAFNRTYRFTDTWMSRGGNWQLIASQVTLLPGK